MRAIFSLFGPLEVVLSGDVVFLDFVDLVTEQLRLFGDSVEDLGPKSLHEAFIEDSQVVLELEVHLFFLVGCVIFGVLLFHQGLLPWRFQELVHRKSGLRLLMHHIHLLQVTEFAGLLVVGKAICTQIILVEDILNFLETHVRILHLQFELQVFLVLVELLLLLVELSDLLALVFILFVQVQEVIYDGRLQVRNLALLKLDAQLGRNLNNELGRNPRGVRCVAFGLLLLLDVLLHSLLYVLLLEKPIISAVE